MSMKRMSVRQKRNKYLAVLSIILAILLGIAGYLAYTRFQEKPEAKGNAYVDPGASDWDAQVEPPDEEEDRILIPGYSGAQMNAGETKLGLRIGNPEENTCYLKAILQLEDGTALYESGLLKPGTGFDEIELNQTLEAGEYQALVRYTGYTMEEEPRELNSSDSAFVLTVNP